MHARFAALDFPLMKRTIKILEPSQEKMFDYVKRVEKIPDLD
jgi:hypothetical protein